MFDLPATQHRLGCCQPGCACLQCGHALVLPLPLRLPVQEPLLLWTLVGVLAGVVLGVALKPAQPGPQVRLLWPAPRRALRYRCLPCTRGWRAHARLG